MKTMVAAALVLIAGCGGSGGGASDFIGTYTVNGTTSWTGCPIPPAPVSGTGMLTIVAGPSDGITTQLDGCNLNWTVSGKTASVAAGQSCSGTLNGVAYTSTWSSGTASLNGSVVTLAGVGGSETFSNPSGTETCSFSQTGTWTKGG
jgi:hypothetical protein